MKKIYGLLMVIAIVGFQACEGPEGPPGIDGRDGKDGVDGVDGQDGGLFLSTVFEAEVNFTAEENFQAAYNLEIYDGDNLLVYIALGVDDEENIVWMPLPQTFFVEQGMVMYNYIFTKKYFSIFMDTAIPAAELSADWTDNQYFRIVVIPGEFYQEGAAARIDFNDYHAVMTWLGKAEADVQTIDMQ